MLVNVASRDFFALDLSVLTAVDVFLLDIFFLDFKTALTIK